MRNEEDLGQAIFISVDLLTQSLAVEIENMSRDAFDPFGEFHDVDQNAELEEPEGDMDPWWVERNSATESKSAALNETYESEIFQFSAGTASANNNSSSNILEAPEMFPDDPMATQGSSVSEQNTVHVALHEQLTSVYDGKETVPSSQVQGSIHARSSTGNPFNLLVRDPKRHLDKFHEDPKFCIKSGSEAYSHHHHVDKLLRITLPADAARKEKVASYTCTSQLKPIPLLVKEKVLMEGDRCRVGVKIRSNPNHVRPLSQIAIIMAVPPDIQGETVKLSRKGGVWDGMKRIVAWPVDLLEPGELIEIQAQFSFVNPDRPSTAVPKFPILVRCEGTNDQFSNVELTTDTLDETCIPVKLSLTRTVRVIFRKV